jgi:hypothetical protein
MNEPTSQFIMVQPVIRLTPVRVGEDQPAGQTPVSAFEMIAYSQGLGHTRLHLTGRRTLDVKETTQEIDRLVRAAHVEFVM